MSTFTSATENTRPALSDLDPQEISVALGLKPYQGRQLFRWIHQKRVFDFSLMSDLAKSLRTELEQGFRANKLSLNKVSESPASTVIFTKAPFLLASIPRQTR